MGIASGVTAGHAYVLIEALDKTGAVFGKVGQRLEGLGQKVSNLGMQMATMGASMAVPIVGAIRAAKDFDYAMRSVRAVMSLNETAGARLETVIRDLGRTTSFTAIEVANTAEVLGRAGLSLSEVIATLPSVLMLARSGKMGLAEAGTLLTRVMRTFKIEAKDTNTVVDQLFVASQNGNATVQELAQSLSYAGGTVAMMDGNVAAALAVLQSFSNNMLFSTKAGTAFNMMLSRLVANADKVKELLGFDVIDKEGQVRDITELMMLLANSLSKMPSGKRVQTLQELFNIRGARGGAAIVNAIGEIMKLYDKLIATFGEAGKASKEMNGGMWGDIQKIKSALTELQISFGMSFADMFRSAVIHVVPVIKRLSDFAKLHRDMAVSIGKATMALVGSGVALMGFGVALKVAGVAMGMFSKAMSIAKMAMSTTFLATTGPVILAIGAVAVALKGVYDIARRVGDNAKNDLTNFGDATTASWNNLAIAGNQLFNAMGTTWTNSVNALADAITPLASRLAQLAEILADMSTLTTMVTGKVLTTLIDRINYGVFGPGEPADKLHKLGDAAKENTDSIRSFFDAVSFGYFSMTKQATELNKQLDETRKKLGITSPGHETFPGEKPDKKHSIPRADVGGGQKTAAEKAREREELIRSIREKKQSYLMDLQEAQIVEKRKREEALRTQRDRRKDLQDIYLLDARMRRTRDADERESLRQTIADKERELRRSAIDERSENATTELDRRRKILDRHRRLMEINKLEHELGARVGVAVPAVPAVPGITEAAVGDTKRNRVAILIANKIESLKETMRRFQETSRDLPEALQKGTVAAFRAEHTNQVNQQIAENTKLTTEAIRRLQRMLDGMLGAV